MLVNFSWVREGRVAGMGMPHSNPWPVLREAGVSALLTLTEHPLRGTPCPDDFRCLHVPLVDFGTPSIEKLERCVTWMEEQVGAGRAVGVHCFAGVGRTGTVIASWMVSQGMDPDEAIRELRAKRPGSVETPGQADAVRRFARRNES
jgi:atypical dual specificity phosphatase